MTEKIYRIELHSLKSWRSNGLVFKKGRPHFMSEENAAPFKEDGYFRVSKVESAEVEMDKISKGMPKEKPALKPRLKTITKRDAKPIAKESI